MCERFQIPHSYYLGGPLEWTPLDREKAEAYIAWKAEACSNCGTRDREWDPEQGGHRFAYVSTTHRCVGCELIEMEKENIPDHAKGVKVGLVPNLELLEFTDDDGDE